MTQMQSRERTGSLDDSHASTRPGAGAACGRGRRLRGKLQLRAHEDGGRAAPSGVHTLACPGSPGRGIAAAATGGCIAILPSHSFLALLVEFAELSQLST